MGYSTVDHLFTINQLLEKFYEHQINIYLAFVDYTKAFDSLLHNFMMKALLNQGILSTWVKLIKEMYTNLTAKIVIDREGPNFPVEKGVKQGDLLSSLLFICTL